VRRRTDAARVILLIAALVACGSCSPPGPEELVVGHHRLHLAAPLGWEHLDHGREQIFRRGEMQISLADLGPASSEGLVREVGDARALWLEGRRKDAFARVRELQGPPLAYASSDQRLGFWRTWRDVLALHDHADSASIGAAFDSLVEGAKRLPPLTPEWIAGYALERTSDTRRREVAKSSRPVVNDSEWIEIETWDRVTHLDRSRLACVDDDGYLLALWIERGPIERAGPTFNALLGSIELNPLSPEPR